MHSVQSLTGLNEVVVPSVRNEFKDDFVEWKEFTLSYQWCHSRRRTLGITVRADKTVSVRVPLRTPVKQVRDFVLKRAEWIMRVWKKLDGKPSKSKQDYGRGATFKYQGNDLHLEFTMSPRHSVCLHGGLLLLSAPDVPSDEYVRKLITSWYKKQAHQVVTERSMACHHMMQKEQIPLPPITLRSMKTRWGSYSYKTKRIALNINLIKAPQECLDYVIIHELCHIKVRHHGPDFWQMVGCYMPDYLLVRKRLKLIAAT